MRAMSVSQSRRALISPLGVHRRRRAAAFVVCMAGCVTGVAFWTVPAGSLSPDLDVNGQEGGHRPAIRVIRAASATAIM